MKKRHDYYFNKAKKENYLARSVYKLEEAQKKYNFIKPKDFVLDIGCAPGSWSKYMLDKIIKKGIVIGIDILHTNITHERFTFIEKDIREITKEDLGDIMFDTMVSDAMPNTTSDKETNHYRSINLANIILEFMKPILKSGGSFFIKVYDGKEFYEYKQELKDIFDYVDVFKPKSSRNESREIYLFCKGYKI